jgi:hypothetical protein
LTAILHFWLFFVRSLTYFFHILSGVLLPFYFPFMFGLFYPFIPLFSLVLFQFFSVFLPNFFIWVYSQILNLECDFPWTALERVWFSITTSGHTCLSGRVGISFKHKWRSHECLKTFWHTHWGTRGQRLWWETIQLTINHTINRTISTNHRV